ncbi:MAG: hypothetical protein J6X55_11955 [Victivallales bacterium]|nr:hypothetical protein [Victivallales bacterium]
MVRCGFGSRDLEGIFLENRPIRERCEAKAFYVESEDVSAVWLVLDFMDFDLDIIKKLKNAVVSSTGVKYGHAHVVTTHNHGCSTCDLLKHDVLCRLAGDCAAMAKKNTRPAKMRHACISLQEQVNYLRRVYIPEVSGTATCFWGPAPSNGFDSSPYVENFLAGLHAGRVVWNGLVETQRPTRPFLPGDSRLFVVEFRSLDDDSPLGSFVRFAAHAVCCNRPEHYSSDYPWHVRTEVAKALGGIPIFFNGPCADIAPGIIDKSSGAEIWLGQLLAKEAVKAVKTAEFHPLTEVDDVIHRVCLPVRKEVVNNDVQVSDELPDDLAERKRLLERQRLKSTLPFLWEKYAHGEECLYDDVEVELGMLRLNDLKIKAFPGETFSSTAQKDDPNIMTVTEHGRTVMYIPPDEERRRGGYESVCSVTDFGAETLLRQAAERLG